MQNDPSQKSSRPAQWEGDDLYPSANSDAPFPERLNIARLGHVANFPGGAPRGLFLAHLDAAGAPRSYGMHWRAHPVGISAARRHLRVYAIMPVAPARRPYHVGTKASAVLLEVAQMRARGGKDKMVVFSDCKARYARDMVQTYSGCSLEWPRSTGAVSSDCALAAALAHLGDISAISRRPCSRCSTRLSVALAATARSRACLATPASTSAWRRLPSSSRARGATCCCSPSARARPASRSPRSPRRHPAYACLACLRHDTRFIT